MLWVAKKDYGRDRMTNKDKLTKLKREVLARLQGKEIYLVNGRYKIGGIRNE